MTNPSDALSNGGWSGNVALAQRLAILSLIDYIALR